MQTHDLLWPHPKIWVTPTPQLLPFKLSAKPPLFLIITMHHQLSMKSLIYLKNFICGSVFINFQADWTVIREEYFYFYAALGWLNLEKLDT